VSLKGREWSLKPKDGEFRGSVVQVCIGPNLKVESFQDVAIALMPSLLPREGETYEESYVPFFPGLPKDKAW
jgi:hypothetical protein